MPIFACEADDSNISYCGNIISMQKILLFMPIALFTLFISNMAFAQLSVDTPTEKKQLATLGLSSPIIFKVSEKGIYNVTVKSAESSSPSGLNFEIVFLNATSSNLSGSPPNASSTQTQEVTVPSTVEQVIPVKNFDMKIVSPDGKELARKINEIPRGGRILENINPGSYTGNITINLDNIMPDPAIADNLKKQLKVPLNQSDLHDSVNIETEIVKS